MRSVITPLIACLCLLLAAPAATHAGIGGKIKSKAKSTAGKVGDAAHKGADKAGDTAQKGVDKAKPKAKEADQKAKGMVDQLGGVFEKI